MANDQHPAGGERVYPFQTNSVEYGLTKRELFAAMAMQGLCANPEAISINAAKISEWSVMHADYLIAELCK